MKIAWWDAPLTLRDSAGAIHMILTMGGSPFCFHGGSSPPFLPCCLTSLPHLSHLATSPLSPTCPTLLPHPSLPYLSHLATSALPLPPCHLTSLPTLPPFHISQPATSPYSYLSHFVTSLPSHLSNLRS